MSEQEELKKKVLEFLAQENKKYSISKVYTVLELEEHLVLGAFKGLIMRMYRDSLIDINFDEAVHHFTMGTVQSAKNIFITDEGEAYLRFGE